ncbi:tetratricopeptide repeat-containing sulfotransferase family protein [Sphingomonas sp. TX0543]|uniref:tetratricopeptide repeat-containing sulfotransferase family protein n=1 Tax=unclassified Sphingomonas TaxID=196159 RepID=UPI0010F709FE|nr:sulfotransferase [Sphingomonas sp. 3P27F8]
MATVAANSYPPILLDAALALHDGHLHIAEPLLKRYLKDDPFDARAIRMLAELAGRIGRNRDAESLLRRALELAPAFTAARANLALVLYRQNRAPEALIELDELLATEPEHIGHANLKAAALGRLGGFEEAIALYERVLAAAPQQPKVWMSYGHMLKTLGRQRDGVAAYRRAIDLQPALGEAWWSLANLKTVRFSDADIAAMTQARQQDGLDIEDAFHLDFALGKALEDRGEADRAFAHYAAGNAARRAQLGYDSAAITRMVDALSTMLTPDFFAARAGWGCASPEPIFVLGMPRAGSTLIEQILSSHSEVEGTTELPDMPAMARCVADYPRGLATLTREQAHTLGEEYLRRASVQRRTGRPFFIDKLPNNWLHVPLIRLILPNARIIDARRDPLACCFSNFKQHFARGQGFSYGLEDMGRYYRDYVRLMARMDAAQPGAVQRVIHEQLVDAPVAGIKALLDALGLSFEPACLSFHETERAVRTASSEQVRQPIFRGGDKAWQPFATHLGQLEAALGDVIDLYPSVPSFA